MELLGPRGYSEYTETNFDTLPFSWIEDEAMWIFLYTQIHQNALYGQVAKGRTNPFLKSTWQLFCEEFQSKRDPNQIMKHFKNDLAPNLHNACMSCEDKVKLYFALHIPVDKNFLQSLQGDLLVQVDSTGRIGQAIQQGNNGLKLTVKPPTSSKDEENELWLFLFKRIHDQRTGNVLAPHQLPCFGQLCKEYKVSTKSRKSLKALNDLFRYVMTDKLKDLDIKITTKAKLCFSLQIVVDCELLEEFRKVADVRIDQHNKIIEFSGGKSGLELVRSKALNIYVEQLGDKRKREPFTLSEERRMFMFVLEKLRDPKNGRIRRDRSALEDTTFWREFSLTNTVLRDPKTYLRRFAHNMVPNIHAANLSLIEKTSLYFGLGVPVESVHLKKIRQTAIIELDEKGCILVYRERKPITTTTTVPCDVVDLDDEEDVDRTEDSNAEVSKIEAKFSVLGRSQSPASGYSDKF